MAASSPPPPTPPANELTDRVLAGRYRLTRPIAAGGMAEVWEAVDEILARRVAVKILHRHLAADKSFVDRFRAEAIAAARLAHPSIVSIYDTFSDDGIEAIVMELVRGTTLRDRLDQRGALDVAEALAIGAQVCDALGVAHRSGLVHRDVKPANILLSNDGRVLVADFGIAKAAEGADLTRDGLLIGTAKYVAPEQVAGGPIDSRTDLYALGVVLYEALCGRAPFVEGSDAATALARLHRDPLRPRQVKAGIPRPVERALMKALARDPTGRFADAASFRAALMSAADVDEQYRTPAAANLADPASTGAPSPVSRTDEVPSFARSERSWLVPTSIILLVAVVLGTAGLLLGQTRAGRELFDQVRNAAGGKTAATTPQRITAATAFDPLGDTRERDGIAFRAVDADPTSAWQTEHYNGPDFAGLKTGVGLSVALATPAKLQRVAVTSPTAGWSAEVYVASGAVPGSLAAWGKPVDRHTDMAAGTTEFDLHSRRASHVLIWITHLGPDGVTRIGDVEITGVGAT